MKPYYQDDSCTIYNCDCREILPTLGTFDLVLTDPPYGIGMDGGNVSYKGANNFAKLDWDAVTPDSETLEACIAAGEMAAIWGGNYFQLPPSKSWLVWDKGEGFYGRTYAEVELAWTNYGVNAKIKKRDPLARGDYHGKLHPTMKPLPLFIWCIELCPGNPQTILDPFAGSCTTGRAAKDLGRKSVMVEKEERYCEIGAKRLAQEVFDFGP